VRAEELDSSLIGGRQARLPEGHNTAGLCTLCGFECGAALSCIIVPEPACFITIPDCIHCTKACPEAYDFLVKHCYPKNSPVGDSKPQVISGPVDPNEKEVVAKKFIQPDQLLVYPIHFENIGDVEAQDVFVTDVLDSNLDASTLNILTPSGASFDAATRTVKWNLLGRNLQPQETGNVLLSIRPKPNLPSGTEIRNKATIQFEVFAPLDTNEVVNVIDSTRPTCTINSLPAEISTLNFPISWSGTDAVGEIESYSVLVSVNGGSFAPFLDKTTNTSATFTGEQGKTYGFLCIATDTAGNIEVQDTVAETTTTITADLCPNDPNKTTPGICGCGAPDTDSDGDGTPDCRDQCPNDPRRTAPSPEICGDGIDQDCNGTDLVCAALSITDVTHGEGNSGTTDFVFTVTLSNPSTGTVTVNYATANGAATAGSDYTPVNGALTFPPGQISKTVTVAVKGELLVEPNETFFVNLSAPSGAEIADGQGLGTILNDDGPILRINDISRAEGNTGTTAFSFLVTLSPASARAVTVHYATADGTAVAGSDYAAKTGVLTFTPGQTSKIVTVNVIGNTVVEPNEMFFVNLSRARGATIFDRQGMGAILNDDGPTLRINNVSLTEGNVGTMNFVFTVTLSPAAANKVTVHCLTANGTATALSDYKAVNTLLTFTPGQTSQPCIVPVIGNTVVEPKEFFTVNLINAAGPATIFNGRGVGTILNDD